MNRRENVLVVLTQVGYLILLIFFKFNKAWFKRRTLHVPNLIIGFGSCKVRRLNQLGSTDLYLGRPAVLFDRACRIERQKIDFVSNVELDMCRI